MERKEKGKVREHEVRKQIKQGQWEHEQILEYKCNLPCEANIRSQSINIQLCLSLDKPRYSPYCPVEGVPFEFYSVSSFPRADSSLALGSLNVGGGSANQQASGPQTSEVVIMWNVLARHELSTRACSTILYTDRGRRRVERRRKW